MQLKTLLTCAFLVGLAVGVVGLTSYMYLSESSPLMVRQRAFENTAEDFTKWLENESKAQDVLKSFCIDLYGYPALNRNGYAWSYFDSSTEPRVDDQGNPVRCMTKEEFTNLFNKPVDPTLSYFDDKK
ncbi:hypothetical protein RZ186_003334 [Vibrio cholerae]|uniref:Sugar porter family MFS transporter n=1 Tax=Vibrio cholerae TaxID=666 RepID=A0ABD7SRR3_VIBCL|nr:sugar porter family MFS transporter [Vibrio cholerae]EGR1049102.1 hypothetical protein [Vibrio cholerae]EGR3963633.1 hypothetical protein [Vibrio cholerae]EGR4347813.1 hypothetical protein [Vibrio cholerae]ELA3032909.1 hypothetical protein [Vibrio cholerae]ELN7718105.1 hypothetical protein [Vibrio cholerae]